MAILILCIDSIFPIFGRENNHKYFVYIYCPGWLFYMWLISLQRIIWTLLESISHSRNWVIPRLKVL